jgi:DNA topoisomerase-2
MAINELEPKNVNMKYYKGLGTSTSAEAKEYFKNIFKHKKTFVVNNQD